MSTTFKRGNKFFELTNHLGNVLVTVSVKKLLIPNLNSPTGVGGYEADVTTATDYFPFGMQMPGRNDKAVTGGGWAQGSTKVNGATVSETLVIDSRTENTPPEYKAATSIEFTDGFTSGSTDEFVALIADATNTTTTNSSGTGNGSNVVSGYRYGFNGKEEDKDINEGTLDFGARICDVRLGGRFFSIDPYSSKYPFESPYSFAGNSPIIAIDKDGKFPIWTHYQMIYEELIAAKVDKKTASEIALFGSTYTDHPTDWYVMPYNKALAINYMYSPSRLNYNNKDYEETRNSQSDELVSSVALHGMRTWWEDITPEQSVNRALYGGTFKERDGTEIKVKGAYEVINEFKGTGISKLSREEKKAFGKALHTVADVKVHKGARWVNEHKKEAKAMGHKNEHPGSHEVPVNKKEHDEADKATQDAIKTVQSGSATTQTTKQ